MNDEPRHFQRLSKSYPAFIEALESLGETVRRMGPLDDKTSQLMQLAAAAAAQSEGALHSHARRAIEAGASIEELRHGLLCLTSTIGFPAVSAAMSWLDDIE
jgi:AhpD family alkylhydroperoxidase